MLLCILPLAVALGAVVAHEFAADLAIVCGVVIALLAHQLRLARRRALGFHHGHERKVDLQRPDRRGTLGAARRARQGPGTLGTRRRCWRAAGPLPRPSLQALPAERVEAREHARRARLGRRILLLAQRTADRLTRQGDVLPIRSRLRSAVQVHAHAQARLARFVRSRHLAPAPRPSL